nr:cytochrome c oxidase subunit 5B, mitochondrial [Odocoileus virginianus texanus]
MARPGKVTSLLPEVLVFVAGVMASRLLRGAGALASQALRARGPNGVSVVRSMASGGGVPTDEEQATGLEREVMLAARKGQDPYNILAPKATSGTKEDPNLVPSITNKRIVGCICKCFSTVFSPFCLFAYSFFCLCRMWDRSSPTRDGIHAPCIGSTAS